MTKINIGIANKPNITNIEIDKDFNDKVNNQYSNKVKIYSNDNGIRINYKFENFEDRESITVKYLIFTAPKKVIGSESFTKSKALIDGFITKYKKKAIELHKGKNDIEVNEGDFKIVYENVLFQK